MCKVLKELLGVQQAEDPCKYVIPKKIWRQEISRQGRDLIAFSRGSNASKSITVDGFWKPVPKTYAFLPNIYISPSGRETNIEWFEFIGKHMKLVNA